MLNFMDYVQQAFFAASGWDRDNSYGALNATARSLLDFPIPHTGLTLNFSSLASPNFATFYTLANTGTVDGSLSYLYSSKPLHIAAKSQELPLRRIIPGYRQLRDLHNGVSLSTVQQPFGRDNRPPTLLYGRLFLPTSHLEALYLRRLSPNSQLKISCVSNSELRSGGSLLFLLSRDFGKYSTEWLYSTDSALLGMRGLYNFGPDPRKAPISSPSDSLPAKISAAALQKGRFSAGAEVYYGILNKSGGMSTGLRFATLPAHTGFPYTMTLTLNPLMGNLSAAYAVRAGSTLALCSRFDFNFYSYESDFQLGVELWRRTQRPVDGGVEWARRKLREPGRGGWGEPVVVMDIDAAIETDRKPETDLHGPGITNDIREVGASSSVGGRVLANMNANDPFVDNPNGLPDAQTAGVLKARVNQDGDVGLLWEGRLKALLCSCGVTLDFKQREQIFRGVGVEVQYSS